MKKNLPLILFLLALLIPAPARAELSSKDKSEIKRYWNYVLTRRKGPYTINYCTCVNGKKAPVADDQLRIRAAPCAQLFGSKKLFCTAYRTDWAREMGEKTGLWVSNLFPNEVYEWDQAAGHHEDIAKGFILEKFYMETHPGKPLTLYRATGGISGAEFEVVYAPQYFAKYYSMPGWTDFKNYFIQYELQRRFYLNAEGGQIDAVRNLATSLYSRYPKFKPIKDLIHNQMSAGLVLMIRSFEKENPGTKASAAQFDKLCDDILRLTKADRKDLERYRGVADPEVKKCLDAALAAPEGDYAKLLAALADLAVASRRAVAAKTLPAAEAVRLVDLTVAANTLMRAAALNLREKNPTMTVSQALPIMGDLLGGVYGAGLMSSREYDEAQKTIRAMQARNPTTVGEMSAELGRLNRVVEWAQTTVKSAFATVWEQWVYLFPDTDHIPDDIIRSSPLLDYASLSKSLGEKVSDLLDMNHDILGKTLTEGVRALNPGLAVGPLAFYGAPYTRENILALTTTNADLEPVSGIITKDEGNVVSHVQLLARALGVPNAVFLDKVYDGLSGVKGQKLFYAITPMGRVILKKAADMNATDKLILAEYEKNLKRTSDGSARGGQKLVIDPGHLKLDVAEVLPLGHVSRKDSGIICGPKAAFLGELARTFPGHVARGAVIPFGVYEDHFKKAKVVPPPGQAGAPSQKAPAKKAAAYVIKPGDSLLAIAKRHGVTADALMKANGIANPDHVEIGRKLVIPSGAEGGDVFAGADYATLTKPGEPLTDYVKKTYDVFFNKMLKDPKMSEAELAAWIKPRLEVIRHSIKSVELDPVFVDSLKKTMAKEGILDKGVFVRSDTNVEDMPNFNGAGLNLTIFNLMRFEDVLDGVKEVWASPFTYRSFSWRQSVISDPNLVYPSIVVLESVPSEKSGVLITADVDTGDASKFTVATSEGVGGAVDGTPAETLLWSPEGVRLLSQFKSATRRELITTGSGGSRIVPSTGSGEVLSEAELGEIISAGQKIAKDFKPEMSSDGRPLAWDVEYGFVGGKLYLFQTRPFVGNSDLKNLPALASLDSDLKQKAGQPFSLKEDIVWRQ